MRWPVRSLVVLVLMALASCGNLERRETEEAAGGDGQLVLFRVAGGPDDPDSPYYDLVILNADGSETPLLGDSVEGSRARPALFARPSWSPDGESVVFDGGYDEIGFDRDIYTVDADGAELNRLTSDRISSSPVWSPGGDTVLFARSFGPPPFRGANLWLMDVDGSNARPLTPQQEDVFDAPGSFSPDGTTIAFTRVTGPYQVSQDGYVLSEPEIYTVGLDGSHLVKLAEESGDPVYSPDGETVVFVSARDRNGELCYGDRCFFGGELYIMSADGSNQERLTATTALNEAAPEWSPDGERIVYQRGKAFDNAEGFGIFAINSDGTCATAVAFDPRLETWYSAPAWRPGTGALGPLDC